MTFKIPTMIGMALITFSLSCRGTRPLELGATTEGQLRPCSDKPNCVSTGSQNAKHRVDVWPWRGTPEESLARIKGIIEQQPRTTVVTTQNTYLHAEFESYLFKFLDDVEFLASTARPGLQVRSASRLGYSDLGANRARIESLRDLYEKLE